MVKHGEDTRLELGEKKGVVGGDLVKATAVLMTPLRRRAAFHSLSCDVAESSRTEGKPPEWNRCTHGCDRHCAPPPH